jgi:cyclic pyranopterin phosphate synthase
MAEDMTFLPKSEVLSLEELDRLCSVFIAKGVKKIRLTGGEPLVRRGVMGLIRSLGQHLKNGNLKELTLTTNGSQLEKHASELATHGVKRVNVSIDTLDTEKFSQVTRGGKLDQVKRGLIAATNAGLDIKINTVVLKDFNEDQFSGLVGWCGERGYDITFIETMPLGEIGTDRTTQYLPISQVRKILEKDWTLKDNTFNSGGTSRYASVAETGQHVGFISPLSHNFCATCNRIRVTCTGKLFMCLGQDDNADLSVPLRASEGNELLYNVIDEAIGRKPKSHDFVIEPGNAGPALSRHMSVTGG